MGPFSVSSRGRVGVNAGPVSFYGGGSRRSSSGGGGVLAFLIGVAVLMFVVMWPLSLWGHAIHLTPSWHQLMHRDKAWMHEHYALVGLRYLGAALLLFVLAAATVAPLVRRERERQSELAAQRAHEATLARQVWLDGPAPPLPLPSRFTQNWIAANVPYLHPGQVPVLLAEMRARGWSEERIDQRVRPYLPWKS
jgi:hypothetical protein